MELPILPAYAVPFIQPPGFLYHYCGSRAGEKLCLQRVSLEILPLGDATLQLGLSGEEMGLNFGQASSAQSRPL